MSLFAIVDPLRAQLVEYSFTGGVATATSVNLKLTAGAMGSNNSFSVSNSSPVSSSYTGSTGSYYGSDSNFGSTGNYFTFTLTPTTGNSISVSSFSFGYRDSSTSGPTSFTIKSSANNYATTLASGSLTADGSWHNTGTSSITLTFTSATTFRLQPTGASTNGATMRFDDLIFSGSVSAVPEPSTYAACVGLAALGVAIVRRRRSAKTA